MQLQHRELDACHGAVQPVRAIEGRHQRAHIAHDEQLARPGAGQEVRHQARIRAPDEQGFGVLPLRHQILKPLLVQWKIIRMKTLQTLQQLIGRIWQR
mgnify:CR=1 FL=1